MCSPSLIMLSQYVFLCCPESYFKTFPKFFWTKLGFFTGSFCSFILIFTKTIVLLFYTAFLLHQFYTCLYFLSHPSIYVIFALIFTAIISIPVTPNIAYIKYNRFISLGLLIIFRYNQIIYFVFHKFYEIQ